jgi:hypothetical protein
VAPLLLGGYEVVGGGTVVGHVLVGEGMWVDVYPW